MSLDTNVHGLEVRSEESVDADRPLVMPEGARYEGLVLAHVSILELFGPLALGDDVIHVSLVLLLILGHLSGGIGVRRVG